MKLEDYKYEPPNVCSKEELIVALKENFEKHPDLKGIVVEGYAPHFNDGDACTFGTGNIYPLIDEPADDADAETCEAWDHREEDYPDSVNWLEDWARTLEIIFGDSFTVTIDRDLNVTVEDAPEHD